MSGATGYTLSFYKLNIFIDMNNNDKLVYKEQLRNYSFIFLIKYYLYNINLKGGERGPLYIMMIE